MRSVWLDRKLPRKASAPAMAISRMQMDESRLARLVRSMTDSMTVASLPAVTVTTRSAWIAIVQSTTARRAYSFLSA